ncbi:ANTAR domain-containing protein [Nocardioides sp. G10]|uniref:ANTAR domain-containing protein n=1 Tax=Nocardioides baculatus TaxID=2801337 RepID=A0ABS1L9Y6_9ACTN|nr:ANTAR domain-containing protein [Nocardioides baculatus]
MIGQAEGILMERLGVGPDEAFTYLRRVSSHTNRKLADIAADIAEHRGQLSAPPSAPPSWTPGVPSAPPSAGPSLTD